MAIGTASHGAKVAGVSRVSLAASTHPTSSTRGRSHLAKSTFYHVCDTAESGGTLALPTPLGTWHEDPGWGVAGLNASLCPRWWCWAGWLEEATF